MPITLTLKICAGLYLLAILIDAIRSRNLKRFLLQLLPLIVLIALDIGLASANAGYLTFGPDASPSFGILGVMFLAILLGEVARYIFYLKGAFNWLDFLTPLCISPLLLLPLMGSLQSVQKLEPIQIVSFALLAFQNGFFWQTVLAKSKPKSS
jgi:hypothetical protein